MSTRSGHYFTGVRALATLLLALFVVEKSSAHGHHDAHHHHHHISERHLGGAGHDRTCGTVEPSKERMIHDKYLVQTWSGLQKQNLKVGGGIRKLQEVTASSSIIIPVCFHVIRPDPDPEGGETLFLDAATLQLSLNALNIAFGTESCCDEATQDWCNGECSIETGIRFAVALLDANGNPTGDYTFQVVDDPQICTTRSVNTAWYESAQGSIDEATMKRTLRRGDARVLNIYLNNPLARLFTSFEPILGHATLPSDYATGRHLDGVVISDKTIVGGSDVGFNEGDTLAHEVGHWLGLFHTFQGGCEVGDLIADTPAELKAASGCPVGRDTCPGAGVDPIHNMMDYSSDSCLYEFVPGQAVTMQAQWEIYRVGVREDLSVADGISTEPLSLFQGEVQNYMFAGAPGTLVTCSTAGNNGDADLFMRVDSPPDLSERIFYCGGGSSGSNEICSANNLDGTIYIALYAFKAFENVILTCTSSKLVTPISLLDDVASDPISLPSGEEQSFKLDVTPSSRVTCQTTGDSGDADLYVRFNAEPFIAAGRFDCQSAGGNSNELCALVTPGDASVLWATIRAFSSVENVILTCTSTAPRPPLALSDGVPSDPVNLVRDEAQSFTLQVEPEARVTCTTTSVGGDGSLYLRWDNEPDLATQTFACISVGFSRNCTVANPYSTLLWATVVTLSGLDGFSLTCTSALPEPISLTDGVPSEPLSLATARVQQYNLDIRRGANVVCETTGSNGDADLFVRFDAPPNLEENMYDCSATSDSSNETCIVRDPGGATSLWVSIEADRQFVGLTLTCTSTSTFPGMTKPGLEISLADGVASEPFSLDEFVAQSFTLDIQSGENVVCVTGGDNGNADLYLRWDAEPDLAGGIFDCSSVELSSDELCEVADPGGASVLWATVGAFSAFENVIILCARFLPAPPITLTDGAPSDPLSLSVFETQAFILAIEPGARAACLTTADSGDADLYIRFGAEPDIVQGDFDCSSTSALSEESCNARDPGGAFALWALVAAYGSFENLSITCSTTLPPPTILTDGVVFGPFSLFAGQTRTFTLAIAAGERVTCETAAASGDADLILRLDAEPSLEPLIYDCASVDESSVESCSVVDPGDTSVLWVVVSAFSEVFDATLTCTRSIPPPPINLFESIPSGPITLSLGELQSFTFVIRPGTRVICETAGDNGDADLYLRWDAEPDFELFIFDCVSAGTGSVETCALDDPGSTVLWATIRPYISFTDVTITCTSSSRVSAIALAEGFPSSPISLSAGLSQTFLLDVRSVSSTVACETLCDNGDADVVVRVDAEPDISSQIYDCVSAGTTSIEECVVSDLEEATSLFVTVLAFVSFEDLTVTCSSIEVIGEDFPVLDLVDGLPSEPFSLLENQVREFKLQTDQSAGALCTIIGDNGDADLFVRWDAAPDLDEFLFDCVSNDAFSIDTCRVLNSSNATSIWASVVAFSSFDDVTVTCTRTQAGEPTPAPTPPLTRETTTPSPTPSSKPPTSQDSTSAASPPVGLRLTIALIGTLLSLAWW